VKLKLVDWRGIVFTVENGRKLADRACIVENSVYYVSKGSDHVSDRNKERRSRPFRKL
jgi:hypothetical protein